MTLPALDAVTPWPRRARWPGALHRAVAAVRTVLGPDGDGGATGGRGSSRARAEEGAQAPRALVALSGGADSLALAVACAVLTATRAGRPLGPVGAVVVDHGLQDGSAAVAAAAAQVARGLCLDPVTVTPVRVVPAGDGPEAAARTARREALARAAEAASADALALVLTAHTADDQAEQVLLGLARGSGTRSLAGIPTRGTLPGGIPVARPLLGLTRADTEAICRWAGIAWFEDPHNRAPALLRSRIRTRVLPALEDPDAGLGPGVRDALTRTAALAAEDADALDAWAGREFAGLLLGDARAAAGAPDPVAEAGRPVGEAPGVVVALDLDGLAALPPAVRRRVIVRAARRAGAEDLSRERVLAVETLVTGARRGGTSAGPVELAGGVRAVREGPGVTCVAEASGQADGRGPCVRLVLIPRRPGC